MKPTKRRPDWLGQATDAIDHLNRDELLTLVRYLALKTNGERLYSETEIEKILAGAEAVYRERTASGLVVAGG